MEVYGNPLQYSCLENPMGGGAWWAAVHGVARSRARLSDFTFTFHFHALEKAMATHSSTLSWRIPGTEEPGGLPSMGSRLMGQKHQGKVQPKAPGWASGAPRTTRVKAIVYGYMYISWQRRSVAFIRFLKSS